MRVLRGARAEARVSIDVPCAKCGGTVMRIAPGAVAHDQCLAAARCAAHDLVADVNGACALCRLTRSTPQGEPASETTSDTRERLLYDALDALGIAAQSLRMCPTAACKAKGAELLALWRRGENLGVLRGERP